MRKFENIIVEEEMEGERLDSFITEQIESLSRSNVKILIQESKIMVNGESRKASYHVKQGETVSVEIPQPKKIELLPRNIPLEIIYQDHDLAVINKPKGLVTHPGHGNWDNTLVNALLFHIKDLSGINGEIRPGIVHRLDKDTSGVLVVAKNDVAHRGLAEQIKVHTFDREYLALVNGIIKENLGTIDAPIERSKADRKKMMVGKNGRPAISNYIVWERFKEHTLVKVKLFTGRTHQIRVHLKSIGHPLVSDPIYGKDEQVGLMLHAMLLEVDSPSTGKRIRARAMLPSRFSSYIRSTRPHANIRARSR